MKRNERTDGRTTEMSETQYCKNKRVFIFLHSFPLFVSHLPTNAYRKKRIRDDEKKNEEKR